MNISNNGVRGRGAIGTRGAAIRKLLGLLALASGLLVGAGEARAATATVSDNFESGGWSFWSSNPSLGSGFISTWSGARSPTHYAFMYFAQTSTSSWQQAYKVFTTAVTPTACSAKVYLNGIGGGGPGAVEMIDSATWTYIGTAPFTLPSGTTWNAYSVSNSFPCTKSIALRVILSSSASKPTELYVDDASVTWTF